MERIVIRTDNCANRAHMRFQMYFSQYFSGFVRQEAAEREGVDVEQVTSPYQLWEGPLQKDDYAVVTHPQKLQVGQEDPGEKYRNNPDYTEIFLVCNN